MATSLETFNDRYAEETLGSRAVMVVISDAYDTDPPKAPVARFIVDPIDHPTTYRGNGGNRYAGGMT
jgi:hypothetical protein